MPEKDDDDDEPGCVIEQYADAERMLFRCYLCDGGIGDNDGKENGKIVF